MGSTEMKRPRVGSYLRAPTSVRPVAVLTGLLRKPCWVDQAGWGPRASPYGVDWRQMGVWAVLLRTRLPVLWGSVISKW
ncbi:hypothetical protein LV75_006251 [Actinokineospora diospyrosa]|uniref:Transposase of IS4/5 family DUF4096 n=1 Tax=Actinokineospora diospyrosa TaxID=103728 RepID=A0ABT1IM21_9PSEU|nr:hypothetical protein [Actinokineospora diospyrosa]